MARMSDRPGNSHRNRNIWAPWRTDYIASLASEEENGCFICRARDGQDDAANLVLWRSGRCLVVLNRYPYTGGHLLIAPLQHVAGLGELDDATLLEMMQLVRDGQSILTRAVKAQGFNIGCNLGQCAGAGLPEHLHLHVVPRWAGDVNFMDSLGKVRVVPISLEELYETIRSAAAELKLPAAVCGG